MSKPDWIKGNSPIEKRLNITAELKRLASDPLLPLLIKIREEQKPGSPFFSDDISRYASAYTFYYLSLERFLPALGYAVRWEKGLRYIKGKGKKFTSSQKKLSERYHATRRYFEYDFFNYLLHARVLMDRVAGISRIFINSPNLPSFTSFSDHKKFFQKPAQPYGEHEEYAKYIRENTDWFEMPLKEVRDHFLVHQGPSHMLNFGYRDDDWDLFLHITIPKQKNDLSATDNIVVSVPQLARDIETFLLWFNNYGLKSLDTNIIQENKTG
jgi:hypothetical protein